MHEAGLMQTALDLAHDEARRAGAIRIRRLVLKVGPDSGVVPDALRFAFEALSTATLSEGAALEFEEQTEGHLLELARMEVDLP